MSPTCTACGADLPPSLLACPGCGRLVHAARLAELKAAAESREAEGDLAGAVAAWREALSLLPASSVQHARVAERVGALAERLPAVAGPRAPASGWLSYAGLAALVIFIVTKGKFLLLGLTKASTFFSMLAMVGVYWTVFGWTFALGIVLSLYVHEMGHVAELVRRGMPASAPMFIPGIGAYVRLHQRPATPVEDARVGLAGPVWGLGAAVACWAAFHLTDIPVLAALARTGAWINLFNLLPVWQLDGGRAFASLTRLQRLLATTGLLAAWFLTHEGLLVLLLLAAGARTLFGRQVERPDHPGLALYLGLVAALSALAVIPVPTVP